MDPAGSAERLGIPFTMHSNASVTPVDPLFCMWTASARKTMLGRVLGESERITVAQAPRRCLPPRSGRQEGLDCCRQDADFTILDRNPLEVDSPDELRNIKVLGTVMGGKAFPAGVLGAGR
jgi:hypothetical protein